MSERAARRLLDRLSHAEVLERLPAGEPSENGALAARARPAFAAVHEAALLRAARSAPADSAVRGRALWLLGRGAQARETLAAARGLEAAAWLACSWLADAPARAEAALSRVLRADPARADALIWRAAARLERPSRAEEALRDLDAASALPGGPPVLALLLRAMAACHLRRWPDAAAAAEGLLALEPSCQAGWAFRFQARLALGDERGAESDYHQARDRDPECGAFYRLDDEKDRRLPRDPRARLACFARAMRRRPRLTALRAAYAEALREPGIDRFDLALREYRTLEPRLGRRAWFQAFYARAESGARGLEASLARLDAACRLFPEGGWLFAWRGETLRRLGRGREALRDLDRAVALQPWYGYARAWRAAALAQLGRHGPARRSLDQALSMSITSPADGAALRLRSLCRARAGDAVGALDDLTAAFLKDAKHVLLPEGAGPAEAARARRLALAARAARPEDPWIQAWLGQVLLASGDAAGAERALGEVLRRDPAHAWARLWRAQARERLGRAAEAERDLARVLRRQPSLWRAGERLAFLLASRGRWRRALAVLERCFPARPSSARFHALRADLLRRAGRPAEAADAARAALALDARYSAARAILAAALSDAGRRREAAAEADRALREDPRLAEALGRAA